MRYLCVWITISIILINSCSHNNAQETEYNSNALHSQIVTVSSPILIDNEVNPEWTASFDKNAFFDTVFSFALTNRIPVYGKAFADFEDIELQTVFNNAEIREKILLEGENGIVKSLNEILFYEKWNFNVNTLKFSKEVLGWCPIKNWKQDGQDKRQKTFYIYPKVQTRGKIIAKSIFYQITWNHEYPTSNVGMDKKLFFNNISEGISSSKIIPYDPIYIVDKSKRKLSLEELPKIIEQEWNPQKIYPYLNYILFEEDWYFDETTFCIKKDVKSFALIQWIENLQTGSGKYKILFFIFPKE